MSLRNATRQTAFHLSSACLNLAYHPVRAWNRRRADVPATILTFHSVVNLTDGYYNVTPERFAAYLEFLHRQRYPVLSVPEYLERRQQDRPFAEPVVLITFDDGYQGVHRHAWPVLKRFGFPATVFLTPPFVGSNRLFPWDTARARHQDQLLPLTWDEVRAMHRDRIEFGSHTLTHPHLARLGAAEIDREVRESKAQIETQLGVPVISFAYPGGIRLHGDFSGATHEVLARAGYRFACTSEIGRNDAGSDLLQQQRIHPTETDSPRALGAKIEGGFDWMRRGQDLFQRFYQNPAAPTRPTGVDLNRLDPPASFG